MLSLPAETGCCRQRLFHDRRRIDEDFDILAGARGKTGGDLLQPALDDIVIIAVACIDGDGGLVPLREQLPRSSSGP